MFDQVLNIASKVSERSISIRIKALLNILFVGSLTSAVFEYVFFEYILIDAEDYENVYRFFIDGQFFIPLSLFFLLWHTTDLAGSLIFKLPNMYVERKFKKSVINFSIEKFSFFDNMDPEAKRIADQVVKIPSDSWTIELLKEFKKSTDYVKISKGLNIARDRLSNESVLIFRAFILITIYFNSIEYFGWSLYVLLFFTIVFIAFINCLAYQFIQIVPLLLWKMDKVLDASKTETPSTPEK